MKINRIITIIMILLQKEKISAKVLADKFAVSLRTIYRDIEVVENAGIPIITFRGSHGGISILKDYKISKGLFTKDDVIILLKGLNLLSSPILNENEKSATLEKIKCLLTLQEFNQVGDDVGKLAIDLSPWFSKENINNKIAIIKMALQEQLLLSFNYIKIKNEKVLRTVEPYKLLFKERQWYLQGYCLAKKDFRIFKLSNMSDINKTEIKFIRKSVPDMFAGFKSNTQQKIFKIKLLIDHSILERVLDYCAEKDIEKLNDAQYLVNFDFIDDDYSYGILMSFGAGCICLEPEHVREQIIQRSEKLLKSYYKSQLN
ncbi:putative transcriptional regulator [Gilliamella apicola SCGC AB-598-I20]|nr:putative transcriptional regulator [Gilliamella apicola SCGC AB-598-I20]